MMQIHVRQDRRNDASLRGTRYRVYDLSIGIQYPCFQPFLDQIRERPIINTLSQHVHQSAMVNMIEEAFDIRFNHPPIASFPQHRG